jgi:sulfur-oxidizing protein SoxY
MFTRRRLLIGASAATLTMKAGAGTAWAQNAPDEDAWPDLHHIFFKDRPISEDSIVTLEAPERAEDAALVPITLVALPPAGDSRRVLKLSLLIDQNPVPLAAAFTFGDAMPGGRISTRVRIDSYSNVRAVAELSDGSLHMATRYVKAAGGCSAPAAKRADEAAANLGQMKFRVLPDDADGVHEALVMLRHPNASGLQMDQVTRLYTPARYVEHLAVYQGDALVFKLEGGISIAEDPNFRFSYIPNGAKTFRMEARDTSGATFTGSWTATRGGA